MSSEDWFQIACYMYEVAALDEITITVLTGEGRFFSAYVFPTTETVFHLTQYVWRVLERFGSE